MKTKWFMPIGAALMVAGLAFANPETPANTQTPSQAAPHHRSANRQQWMQQRFDRMANYLNLTDAQKTQAKSIMQQSRQSTANVRTQLEQNRAALKQAIKADKTSEIDRLSKEQGRLMGQMIAAHRSMGEDLPAADAGPARQGRPVAGALPCHAARAHAESQTKLRLHRGWPQMNADSHRPYLCGSVFVCGFPILHSGSPITMFCQLKPWIDR